MSAPGGGDGGRVDAGRIVATRGSVVLARLRMLEPLACLALGLHALAVHVVATDTVWSAFVFTTVLLGALGVAGLLGWRGGIAIVVRATVIIVLGFVLMAMRVDGSGYVLLWYFLVVAVYPVALPRGTGGALAVVVPLVYLGLVPLDAADGPLPVAAVRAVALGLIAVFVHAAAAAFRDAVAERDEALALLRSFADALPVGLGMLDLDLRVLWLNHVLAELSGQPVAAHVGRTVGQVPGIPPAVTHNLGRVLATGGAVDGVELTVGDRYWRTGYFPVRSTEGLLGVGVVVVEVTEQREAARALTHSATHDALTGLPNRHLFTDRVEVAVAQASRDGQEHVAVLLCDLDRFSILNESLGHAAGDALLVATARRLADVVRAGDTIARLGGDEFGILITQLSGPDQARSYAERVCGALREPFLLGERLLTSTGSVGVAIANAGAYDAERLIRDADVAMYQAKDAGRNRVAVFDPRVRRGTSERFELQDALRGAVTSGQISVVYQPIIALAGGAVVGLEALARWDRPGRGPVPPATFIPIAEDLGLIGDLGEHVLRVACQDVRRWRDSLGLPLTVAVNVSAVQLVDATCPAMVARVLAEVGLPAAALELEVTESVLMADVDVARRRLGELKDLGIGLAIDDFGTGYSSLAYLRDLPTDALKIDRTFTALLPADRPLVAFVVDLARAIGASTVVEGVETPEQLQIVTELGCDQAQGYHLSRPLHPDAVPEFVRGRVL